MIDQDNLHQKQINSIGLSKYAIYLPALSSFYANYIGLQASKDPNKMISSSRMPNNFNFGVEGLNFLDKKNAYFYYPYVLHSAGHANLANKDSTKEYMIRNRDKKNTLAVGDSGGFQIAKGVWEANWSNPADKQAMKYRKASLDWLCDSFDYAMTLDIPTWIVKDQNARDKTNIKTHQEAVAASQFNAEYFLRNRTGNTKFLNVLQGQNHADAEDWYQTMKKYCDPKQYSSNHFNGWGMGGQNMCDPELILKRIISLRDDRLLEKGVHDWIHFLGTSKLEWACFLTDIQKSIRKYHNSNLTISFDCASPFLATANGQLYINNVFDNRQRWGYKMDPTLDNKKYSKDNRKFSDIVKQEKIHKIFQDSPITQRLLASDICVYGQGDLNKIGKEGKTSWDSFSYTLLMAHNVWMHITAVQEANRLYENKISCPNMLVNEKFNQVYMSDLVDEIFSSDTGKALSLIKKHNRFLMGLVGTRGNTGKNAINAQTNFNNLFDIIEPNKEDEELSNKLLEDLEKE